jgi:hypothetical protein
VNISKKRKLCGLKLFTDETGMLQHSKFGVIDRRHGYTTDDNARAMIAAMRYNRKHHGEKAIKLAKTYLEFLTYAHIDGDGFHNIIGYDKSYQDNLGTEDCVGHAIWAVGYMVNSDAPKMMRQLSRWLFDESFPTMRGFTSPRGRALSLLGLCEYLQAFPKDENLLNEINVLSDYFVKKFEEESDKGWAWFEPYLTYANARIPHALFEAARLTKDQAYLNVAKQSLDFLIAAQFKDGMFIPVGTKGWFNKGGSKALFDQQPIEASCMVDAAVSAALTLNDESYLSRARQAFGWFHGANVLGVEMVDEETYTCYDGLTPDGPNLNMGAESTICYLLADLALDYIDLQVF